MTEIDSTAMIKGIANDLKIAIDDLTGVIISIQEDLKALKRQEQKGDNSQS